ncbi:MAG TPA: hypothetical protein VF230_13385 [Acidimicrobiales bacterium]
MFGSLAVVLVATSLQPAAASATEAERSDALLEKLADTPEEDRAALWSTWTDEERALAEAGVQIASVVTVTSVDPLDLDGVCETPEDGCLTIHDEDVHTAEASGGVGMTGASASRTSTAATDAAMDACDQETVVRIARNKWRRVLWEYATRAYWCVNGTRVTDHSASPFADVRSLLWDFVGHQANDNHMGPEDRVWRHFAQGKFKYCLIKDWGCPQTATPWVQLSVTGPGAFEWDTGG